MENLMIGVVDSSGGVQLGSIKGVVWLINFLLLPALSRVLACSEPAQIKHAFSIISHTDWPEFMIWIFVIYIMER